MKMNNVTNKERAAVFVEFALGALLFLVLLIGIIDLGWIYHKRSEQEYAANQVVQLAAVMPGLEGTVAPSINSATDVVHSAAMQRLRARASEVLTQSNGLAVSDEFHFSREPFAKELGGEEDYSWVREAIMSADSSPKYNPDLNYVRFSYPICQASALDNGKCKIYTDRSGKEHKRAGMFSIYLPAAHEQNTIPSKEALEEGLKSYPIVAAIDLDQSMSFLVNFFQVGSARTRVFASAYRELSTSSNMPLALGCDGKPLVDSNSKNCPHETIDGAFCDWDSYDESKGVYKSCWCDQSLGFKRHLSGNSCECQESGNNNASYVANNGSVGCHCEENESNPCDNGSGWFFSASSCGCERHYCCSTEGEECAFTTVQDGSEICNTCNCGSDEAWETEVADDGTMSCKCIKCGENEIIDDQHHCSCNLVLKAEADENDKPNQICDENSIINDKCKCEKCGEHTTVDVDKTSETYNTCICNLALEINKDKEENKDKEICEGKEYFIDEEICECQKCPEHYIVNEENECICNLTSLPSHVKDDGKEVCKESETFDPDTCSCSPCGLTNYIAVSDKACACKFTIPVKDGDATGKKYADGKYACKGVIQESKTGCKCVKCGDNYKFVVIEGVGTCECNLTLSINKKEGDGKKACAPNETFDEKNCKCVKCGQHEIANAENECVCNLVLASEKKENDGKEACLVDETIDPKTCQCVKCDEHKIADSNNECVCNLVLASEKKDGDGKEACEEGQRIDEEKCECIDCGVDQVIVDNQCVCKYVLPRDEGKFPGAEVCEGIIRTNDGNCECIECKENAHFEMNEETGEGECVCDDGYTKREGVEDSCEDCDGAVVGKPCNTKEEYGAKGAPAGKGVCQSYDGKWQCKKDANGNPQLKCVAIEDKSKAGKPICCNDKDPNCLNTTCDKYPGRFFLCCKNANTDSAENQVANTADDCIVLSGYTSQKRCPADKPYVRYARNYDKSGNLDEYGCDTGNLGICRQGQFWCTTGSTDEFECKQIYEKAKDDSVCNGKDDDCDGEIDEDYNGNCNDPKDEQGNLLKGICSIGKKECIKGEETACMPVNTPAPSDKTCNGQDDDCDGLIDEDFPKGSRDCIIEGGVSTNACDHGSRTCPFKLGQSIDQLECIRDAAAQKRYPQLKGEACDGIDNNCDGTVDNDDLLDKSCDTGKPGICNIGKRECTKGKWSKCVADVEPGEKEEVCDGLDNDCDGEVDEGLTCNKVVCKEGENVHSTKGDDGNCYCDIEALKKICGEDNPYVEKDCSCGPKCQGDLIGSANGCVCPANMRKDGDSCVCGDKATVLKDENGKNISCQCENSYEELDEEGNCRCKLDPEDVCKAGEIYMVDEEANICMCGTGCGDNRIKKKIGGTARSYRCENCDPGYTPDGTRTRCICTVEYMKLHPDRCLGSGDSRCDVKKMLKNDPNKTNKGGTPWILNTRTCEWVGRCNEDDTGINACICPSWMIAKGGGCVCPVNTVYKKTGQTYSCFCDEKFKDAVDKNGLHVCSCNVLDCNTQNAPSKATVDENGVLECTCGGKCADNEIAEGENCVGCKGENSEVKVDENGTRYCGCINDLTYDPDKDQPCLCVAGSEMDKKMEAYCKEHKVAYLKGECKCDWDHKCIDVEICGDGIDNDCDGKIDEEDSQIGKKCSNGGTGACFEKGEYFCNKSTGQIECNAPRKNKPPQGDYTCDGIDDDCDGEVDEDVLSGPQSCTVEGAKGVCADGERTCPKREGEGWSECIGKVKPNTQQEVFDCLDNNCDGNVDEGFGDSVTCQTGLPGVCGTGTMRCENGVLSNCIPDIEKGSQEELCDELDNDCDGEIDEGFGHKVGDKCTAGKGECKAEGHYVCSEDRKSVVCDVKAGEESDEICDGKDNNCNGEIDEGFGVGEKCNNGFSGKCKREGVYECKDNGSGVECNAEEISISKEDSQKIGQRCDNGQLGKCLRVSKYDCKKDGSGIECPVKKVKEGQWLCNHEDNNCNGTPDDEESGHRLGESCYPEGSKGECGTAGTYQCQNNKVVCVGFTDKDSDGNEIKDQCTPWGEATLREKGILDICTAGYTRTCKNGNWSECSYSNEAKNNCCEGIHEQKFKKSPCADLSKGGEACDYIEECNGKGHLTCKTVKKPDYDCGPDKKVENCRCVCKIKQLCDTKSFFNEDTCRCQCQGPLKTVCDEYNVRDCTSMCVSEEEKNNCLRDIGNGKFQIKSGCNRNLQPNNQEMGKDGRFWIWR